MTGSTLATSPAALPRGLARYAGLVLGKGGGAGATLALNALLARLLVPELAGAVFFAIALATFASLVARVGMDIACLRQIAALARRGQLQCFDRALAIALLANVPVIALGVVVMAQASASAAQFAPAALLFGAATLGLSFSNIGAETLKARGRTGEGLLWQTALQPALTLLLIVASGAHALPEVVACFIAAYLLAALGVQIRAWQALCAPAADGARQMGWKPLFWLGLPLMGIAVMNAVIELSDTLLLGTLRSAEEVSVYYICAKLAALSTTLLFVINGSIGPQLSRLWTRGDYRASFELVRRYSRYMLLLAALVLLALVLLRPWLLAVFGERYVEAGRFPLLVLAIGYFFVLAAGPLGIFMTMTGHQRGYLHNNLVACGLNLALNLALIPRYGVDGACFATAVALCLKNALLFFQFRSIRKGVRTCRSRK